jgi:hypothetical protein
MTLAAETADPDKAREWAEKILSQKRFQEPKPRRALSNPFGWIGKQLAKLFHWNTGGTKFSGGEWIWGLIAGVAVLVALILITRAIRLRGRTNTVGPKTRSLPARESSAALQRQADHAAAAGDFVSSVRLRFRAGLAALDERGVLPGSDNRTNGTIATSLGDAAKPFREVATVFDALRYGNLVATQSHDESARNLWVEILTRSPRPQQPTRSGVTK